MTYPFNTNNHIRLENIRLYEECEQLSKNTSVRKFYLEVSYLSENEKEVRRIVYPKVELPIIQNRIPEMESMGLDPRDGIIMGIDLGFGLLKPTTISLSDEECFVYSEQIEAKTIDMTIEEIEAKLGHKIRIVTKEESEK